MGELDNNNSNYPEHTRQGGDLVKCFWCEENGIDIRPEYHYKDGTHKWRISITINNKYNKDPKVYDKKDIMEQIYKYSEYYFDKYCTNKDEMKVKAERITRSANRWRKTINNNKYE
jgi:hypothetical protein